ncbi:alpha-hydroxy acid oxidase [Aureimonas pseudogalii]|uniref:4-hydroxymandelate oxidase n=1 Tax=Aureimonas pseudogalii TaxID=1744844 RepID=A0A7W6H5S6_9HYPH|nr:alpha-hydroxy acid oxidase [Aureimonas pseudogalii]MBB3999063.1 4-hydroxymandelate oxidase [Aureimonas pseudogalii]
MTAPLPFADEARAVLGEALYRYMIGQPRDAGPDEGDRNAHDLTRYRLLPRVLTGAEGADVRLPLLGRHFAGPIAVGAYAGDRVFNEDGLMPIARVCQRIGLPLMVSEETVTPLAEITTAHDAAFLQLRAAGPVDRILGLLDTAADAKAMGLVLTVLAPVHPVPGLQPGGFSIGEELVRRGWSTIGSTGPGVSPLSAFPGWGWPDIATVCRAAAERNLPVLLKGVLHPDDATKAESAGAAGIIASNIGLRQSGRWAASARQLPALRGETPLPLGLDGGVRNGTDLVVARCLGADFAVTVRPVITALVGGGEAALEAMLRGWLDEALAITSWLGAASLAELRPSHLVEDGGAR